MTTALTESLQSELAQAESPAESPTAVFQALGCLQGTYTPLSPNCLQGTLTTPDGVRFSAALRSRVMGYLKHKFGLLEPGQPFPPDGKPLRWKVYPKVEIDGSLHLQIMLVVTEFYRLPPDRFTITGLLTQQDEQEQKVSIRVYRNTPADKSYTSLSPQFFPLRLVGYLPDLKVGQIVQLSACREGTKLVITEAQGVTIDLDERMRRAIEQALKPKKPLPPPVKRSFTEAAQPEVVQLETGGGEDAEGNVSALCTDILQQLREPSEPVNVPETPTEVPPTQKASPKHKQASTPAIEPVEPQPVAAPQPEPSTIPIAGGDPNALNPPIEAPAVSETPAVAAAKSKKKQFPSPAAPAPSEWKPEAAAPPKPKFLVQVDRQTFGGQSSVVLKAGMLSIDGKPIARTKLAIVVGEPQQVSADGKTPKSGNRTILSSR